MWGQRITQLQGRRRKRLVAINWGDRFRKTVPQHQQLTTAKAVGRPAVRRWSTALGGPSSSQGWLGRIFSPHPLVCQHKGRLQAAGMKEAMLRAIAMAHRRNTGEESMGECFGWGEWMVLLWNSGVMLLMAAKNQQQQQMCVLSCTYSPKASHSLGAVHRPNTLFQSSNSSHPLFLHNQFPRTISFLRFSHIVFTTF